MKTLAYIVAALALGFAALVMLTPYDSIDRCLDHGGRWDYAVDKCECTPEELHNPNVTQQLIDHCDKPIPGPALPK